MTLLEKIKNYKWFDSPNKLKPILEELYNSIGGGTQDLQSVLDNGNISSESINLENSTQFTRLSPGSISLSIDDMGIASEGELGATQLKFTSDLGYTNTLHPNTASISSFYFPEKTGDYTLATLDDISLQTAINGGNTTDSDIWMLPTGDYTLTRSSTQASPVGIFNTESVPTLPSSLQSVLALGIASNVPEDIIVPTIFSELKPNVNTTGNSIFYLPIGSGGEATLATLDDIYKIPNLPIYANNTSAISGGLVVDSIYKTVTGELRIVV